MLAERDFVDVATVHMPESKLVEIPTCEIVQVVDVVLVAPVDDVLSTVVVTLHCCFGAMGRLVVEV